MLGDRICAWRQNPVLENIISYLVAESHAWNQKPLAASLARVSRYLISGTVCFLGA